MRHLLQVLLFLGLVAEVKADHPYSDKWSTFMAPIGAVLMDPIVKLPLFDILVLVLLVIASFSPRGPTHRPVLRAALVSAGALIGSSLWGLARDGNFRQLTWQLHPFGMMIVLAFTIHAICRTPSAFAALARTFVFAALYRALMVFVFWIFVVRLEGLEPAPPTMTTHGDTVLFVTGIAIVVAYVLERRSLRASLVAAVVGTFLVSAIQLNHRRIAWISLLAAVGAIFWVAGWKRVDWRMRTTLWAVIPVIALWLSSSDTPLSEMIQSKDASSATRDIENYNLLQTAKAHPLLGTGWGHPYEERSVANSIVDAFAQYRYIPHNSVLGLLAFTGIVGFAATWMIFPIVVLFSVQTHRTARDATVRAAALVVLAEVAIYVIQMWGDMGFTSSTASILMGAGIAACARFAAVEPVYEIRG